MGFPQNTLCDGKKVPQSLSGAHVAHTTWQETKFYLKEARITCLSPLDRGLQPLATDRFWSLAYY